MKIRRAKVDEWKKILKLLRQTPELQGSGNKIDSEYTKDYIISFIKDKQNNVVLIAKKNKEIMGILTADIFKKKRLSYLTDLVVKEQYRNRGIGNLLYNKFEYILKNNKIITLAGICKTNNKIMHKFLKKHNIKLGEKMYYFQKRLK